MGIVINTKRRPTASKFSKTTRSYDDMKRKMLKNFIYKTQDFLKSRTMTSEKIKSMLKIMLKVGYVVFQRP